MKLVRHRIALPGERAALADHDLVKPIVEDLQRAIELLTGSVNPYAVFDEAIALVQHASAVLRKIEPEIDDDMRDEARKRLARALKGLRETQSIYQQDKPDTAHPGF
jgi:hypothetical protein